MFERFSLCAISALVLAEMQALAMGDSCIEELHIFSGLAQSEGIAGEALKAIGYPINSRLSIEEVVTTIDVEACIRPLTQEATRALRCAWTEQLEQKVRYVGTAHLLLGLFEEKQGFYPPQFLAHKVDLARLRPKVLSLQSDRSSDPRLKEIDYCAADIKAIPRRTEPVRCPMCANFIPNGAIKCRLCGTGLSDKHFKPCPHCAETIRLKAIICRYCHSDAR